MKTYKQKFSDVQAKLTHAVSRHLEVRVLCGGTRSSGAVGRFNLGHSIGVCLVPSRWQQPQGSPAAPLLLPSPALLPDTRASPSQPARSSSRAPAGSGAQGRDTALL